MKKKLFWIQWVPMDWYKDTRKLSPLARAAWVDIIGLSFDENERGHYARTWEQAARELAMTQEETKLAITELISSKVAEGTICPDSFLIMSRRVMKEETVREKERIKKRNQRVPDLSPRRPKSVPSEKLEVKDKVKDRSTSTPLAVSQQKALAAPHSIHPCLIGLELYVADEKLKREIWKVDKAWMKAYPGVSLEAEIRSAHAWEMANPSRRKVNRIRFLNGWLSRSQDRGGNRAPAEKTITLRKEGGYIGHEGDPDKYANLAPPPLTQQEFDERMRRNNAENDRKKRDSAVPETAVGEHKA